MSTMNTENNSKKTAPKLYVIHDGEDANMPKIKLLPHSFVEFMNDSNVEFLLGWNGACFGMIKSGILYWTCVEGLNLSIEELINFHNLVGDKIDTVPGANAVHIRNLLSAFGIRNLKDFYRMKGIVDYGLAMGIIRMEINGIGVDSWDELVEWLFEREIDEMNVEMDLRSDELGLCMRENLKTRDECLMWQRYQLHLEDFLTLLSVDLGIKEIFEDAEIFQSPEISGNRVVIGRRGYKDVYLEDIFPYIDGYGSNLREFLKKYRKGEAKSYDEFLLLNEKRYTLEDFENLIAQGLVSVKIDGEERKITKFAREGGRIMLEDTEGNKHPLREAIRRKALRMPLEMSYRKYLKNRGKYRYYVEWKMQDNVKYSAERAPKNLEELKELAEMGLVRADGREVKTVKVKGEEVFFVFDDGDEREMYHYVAPMNRFEIFGSQNGNISWIRRFIAEGYKERNGIKLALVLKRHELAKKKGKLSIQEIAKETGISPEQLEIYLRSDLFKRFGELRKGFFYIHPDISEFKKSVNVRKDENYEVIVVDGRNVMYGGEEKDKKKGRVERINAVYDYLIKQGVPEERIIIIVKDSDFNTHRVDDVESLRKLERSGVVRSISNDYDDKVILSIALEERNGLIITNDNYREFVGDHITREDIDRRLLNFTFRGKNFHIKREHRSKLDSFIESIHAIEEE